MMAGPRIPVCAHSTGDLPRMNREQQATPRSSAQPPKLTPATLPPRKYWPWFFLVLLVNYLLVSYLFPQPNAPVTVPYTVFREEAGKGNVSAIYSRGTTIEGRFKTAVTWPTPEDVKQAGQTPPRTALDRRL